MAAPDIMKEGWKKLWTSLASLRLTVVLLTLSMMLVFLATMAQTELGIWEVMSRYIRTFVVWQTWPGSEIAIPVFPGGWLLGGALLVNLLAAHVSRFRLSWKNAPLLLIHVGLIVLLAGELLSGLLSRETQMVLDEGQTGSFTEAPREAELALVETSDTDCHVVWSIPESRLRTGEEIREAPLPLALRVERFFPNARVARDAIHPLPRVVSTEGRNAPAAVIEVREGDTPIGRFLIALEREAQTFTHGGKHYEIALRPKRFYKPYTIRLEDFVHEKHPGTEVPRAFSSLIRLRDPLRNVDREVLISMNHPLRYGGETFYQASFANDDKTSVLQVVRNPGWLLPYVASGMVGLGLLWRFGLGLARSPRRPVASPPRAAFSPAFFLPAGAGLVAALWLASGALHRTPQNAPDSRAFGRLPVLADGRLKCFDTLARGSLLSLRGSVSSLKTPDGRYLNPAQWLLTVLARPRTADALPVFSVYEPGVIALLKQAPAPKHVVSFDQVQATGKNLREQARLAEQTPRGDRSVFQRAILKFGYALTLYWRLRHSLHAGDPFSLGEMVEAQDHDIRPLARRMQEMPDGEFSDDDIARVYRAAVQYSALADMAQFRPVPYRRDGQPRGEWVTVGESLTRSLSAKAIAPPVDFYGSLLRSYALGNWQDFNSQVVRLQAWMDGHFPEAARRARLEANFNHLNLFAKCAALYVAAFLCLCAAWLVCPGSLGRLAAALLGVAFVGHTAGLVMRMIIQERPPVTSLYASIIFVGWVAVLLGLILERVCRNRLGAMISSLIGFATLIIAHHLTDGDTVEVMRAVLDSNFWLTTHVVAITIGYAACFVAGMLGAVYLLRRAGGTLTPDQGKSLSAMIYGVVGFALIFSFAGTILGGIWADQSWGRFWGWDPKENGALLIVLANAIFLHLRWGRLVGDHVLAACAVFGNIITCFSWFGVNMLGVGLHSYGFMEGAPFWLGLFIASQLVIIGLGFLPEKKRHRTPGETAR